VWYGAPSADAIGWAVPRAINVVSLGPATRAREISDRYRNDWAALGRAAGDLPNIGITRHIVVATTDDEARRIARRAYAKWIEAMTYIWRRSNVAFPLAGIYPQHFDALEKLGHGVAGSTATVRDYIKNLRDETGVNYVLCQNTFGDMTFAEAEQSLQLFGRDVLPAFAA
jgi:alkanesulfonate monooxygenase SsuD/methylene tetrahydromethanopterin reductase-like flavin-dependent oxidoreductase (luciferase family)